jgi:predicted enzyme related to lactoylglutathione lyase
MVKPYLNLRGLGGTVSDHSTPSESPDPGVEASVARPGGISYLGLPARDVRASAEFYRDVLGWQLRGDPDTPSFADGTGHVIGHFRTDMVAAGDKGFRPYVYVSDLDATVQAAAERGAAIIREPYAEGSLRIAVITDPADNVIGIWTG